MERRTSYKKKVDKLWWIWKINEGILIKGDF